MNISLVRWSASAFVIGLFTVLSSGCVVPDGGYGYGYDAGVDIGLDYYEPYGDVYDGWGPGYLVVPFRDRSHRPDHGGHLRPHAYRSAPSTHSIPSIPSRPRSGDSRSPPRHGSGNMKWMNK